jgi:SAM-dependent methyltransferase
MSDRYNVTQGTPMNTTAHDLANRLERERAHAAILLESEEKNWNWHTPAGKLRLGRRLEFLVDAVPADRRSEAVIIEVGAGTGTYSAGLSAAYPRLVATDISPDLLAKARARVPGCTFEVMDAHALAVPDGSLDAVVGCSILHHLDWGRAARDYFRALKSGGRIRFSEPNLLNPQIFLQKSVPFLKRMAGDSPDEYAFTRFSFRRVLEGAGFRAIRIQPFEFLHPATPERWIPAVKRIESRISATPLVEFGGSLLISAEKP